MAIDSAKTANTCLFSSGFNELGQLGIGYKSPNKASPTLHHVGFFDTHRLGHQIKLGCGGAFSVAASDDGRIYVWGSGEKGELGLGDGFALKSYGIPHVVALPVIRSPKVKLLSCGLNHTIVVTEDNEAFGWGLNYLAELGLGDSKLVATPQRIPFPAGTRIKQVACGSNHSLVLTEAGRLFSMGHNGYGELGLGDNGQRLSPSHVNHFSTTRVRAICAGGSFSFAITEDEKLWAWGNNVGGELGLGNTVASYNTPQLVPFFANKKIKLMSSGHCHTLVYTETGELYVFGDAFDGQLGLGDEVAHPEPTLNPFFSNYRIKTIHASFFHSFVVTDEGRVFAFGSNSAGHLMLGKPDRHINTPQEILYFKLHKRNCRQVAAGYCHALFVCGGSPSSAIMDSYRTLQKDLSDASTAGVGADFPFEFCGVVYQLHTQLLHLRCPQLLRKKYQRRLSAASASTSGANFLRFIKFIYSETLDDMELVEDLENLFDILKIADTIKHHALTNTCTNTLLSNLGIHNAVHLMVEASKRSLVDVVVLLCDFVELHKADFTDEELLVYESKKALMAAPSIALKSSGSLSPAARFKVVDEVMKLPFDVEQLFSSRSEESCDFKIAIGNSKHVYAHRFMLACRNDFFRACIMSNMRESQTGELKLEEASWTHSALEGLIHYLYTSQTYYLKDPSDCIQVLGNARMMCLTPDTDTSRDNAPLIEHCEKTILESLTKQNCLSVLVNVDMMGNSFLKNKIVDFVVEVYFDLPEEILLDVPQRLLLQIFNRVLKRSIR